MILQSLRDLALGEGLLDNPDFEPKPVAWIIVLDDRGRFINLQSTLGEGAGKKARPKALSIPRRLGRSRGAVADFLVDKSEYVLGVEPDGKRSEKDLNHRRGLFKASIQNAYEDTKEDSLATILDFLSSDDQRNLAIEKLKGEGYKSNDLFAFEHNNRFAHELPNVGEYFSRSRRKAKKDGAQCLVCGNVSEPVQKHPVVKIPGGSTSGVALVSFNKDAFESYGLLRNQNAPVCRDCADAYTTALNRLLSDSYPDPRNPGMKLPKQYFSLAPDTTAVYWTDQPDPLIGSFRELFEAPDPETIGAMLSSPYKGRASGNADNRFFCLILSGGEGRATIRSSHIGTVSEVGENIASYFRSLQIEDDAISPLRLLMRSLVFAPKKNPDMNLVPGFVADIFLAILFGRLFPRNLLANGVERCRAERRVSRERAAILKAFLIRNSKQEVSVGLNKDNRNVGYRLGRLMAILEGAQTSGRKPNKTIIDRYYGAASTRPGIVFPRLLAMAQHHISKLSGGLPWYFQNEVSEILDGIRSFPTVMSLEEQGQFALGYYHQRFHKSEKSATGSINDATEEAA